MNEKLKTGLLVVIAAALIVNVYFLATGGSSDVVNPADARASFERTPAATTAAQARQDAANAASAIDPMNATQVKNDVPAGPLTSLKFDDMSHDFGTIYQDTENKKVFTFTNTGSEPLIIENAKGSCGCTVPKYPKEPIAPGQTGEIEVVYKPGKQKNKQTKNVTITANTAPANTVLTISAEVLES